MGRAVELARSDAIAIMVSHEKIECKLTRLERTFSGSTNDHTFRNFRRAGSKKLRTLLYLDHAYATCTIRLKLLTETEVWYLNASLCSGGKNGSSLFHRHGYVIYR
jgi:hypothetical protein